jgi:hypothetical protein
MQLDCGDPNAKVNLPFRGLWYIPHNICYPNVEPLMDHVAESKRMFDDGTYQWPNALGIDLHQRNPRLVAQWTIFCSERILAHRFPARMLDLQNDLDNAKIWLASPSATEAQGKMEYEIWCRPNRDAPQTAISKLFTAIRELYQRGNCVGASGAAISNLTVDNWGDINSYYTSTILYDIVLQAYYDTISMHGSNGNVGAFG